MKVNNTVVQTQDQFEMLHGDCEQRASVAKAAYMVLFSDCNRKEAAKMYGITTQAVSKFLKQNECKHERFLKYCGVI